jgi:hypothetical protein
MVQRAQPPQSIHLFMDPAALVEISEPQLLRLVVLGQQMVGLVQLAQHNQL